MDGIHGDKLRGHLENLVLAALRKGDAHGFEILKRLDAAGAGALRLKEGSLYPALYRLEAEGLVKATWEDGETARRGPRRRIYRLTAKGGKRLEQSRGEWDLFVRVIGGILNDPARSRTSQNRLAAALRAAFVLHGRTIARVHSGAPT